MYFYTDEKNKLIWGWSAKCGCSHIKNLILEYEGDNSDDIHQIKFWGYLPVNIDDYDIIIVIRDPFKRIVSGFRDKLSFNGELREIWEKDLTFSSFVDSILKQDKIWRDLHFFHHFCAQTGEGFDSKILESKSLKIFDLENIDYKYIEEKIGKKISDKVKNKKKFNNHTQSKKNNDNILEKPVYNLNIDEYDNHKVNYKYFYDEDLIIKVQRIYENDFKLARFANIDYEVPKI